MSSKFYEITVYNWTGTTSPPMSMYLVNEGSSPAPFTIPPSTSTQPTIVRNEEKPTSVQLHIQSPWDYYYTLPVQNNASTVYLLCNPDFQPPPQNTLADQYSYTNGYDPDSTYIVIGGYYSDADSYTYPGGSLAIGLASRSTMSGLQKVPNVTGGGGSVSVDVEGDGGPSTAVLVGLIVLFLLLILLVAGGAIWLGRRKRDNIDTADIVSPAER